MTTTLTAREISDMGYWDCFCALRGMEPHAMNEGLAASTEFTFSREDMEVLRGQRPLPEKEKSARELPEFVYLPDIDVLAIPGPHNTNAFVAADVESKFGALLADAPKMLKALRALTKESLGDWVYSVRDSAVESDPSYTGNSWEHPRVASWGEACNLAEEIVKRHADL